MLRHSASDNQWVMSIGISLFDLISALADTMGWSVRNEYYHTSCVATPIEFSQACGHAGSDRFRPVSTAGSLMSAWRCNSHSPVSPLRYSWISAMLDVKEWNL